MISYERTAEELARRIAALIPMHPEIMRDDFGAWDLLKIKEFKCDDLAPSAFQAGWALGKARRMVSETVSEDAP